MKEINVIFTNGRKIVYTMNIFQLLKIDPQVLEIMDSETGEILYSR